MTDHDALRREAAGTIRDFDARYERGQAAVTATTAPASAVSQLEDANSDMPVDLVEQRDAAEPIGEEAPAAATSEQGSVGFLGADDYLAQVPETVPWVWRGYLARGAVTMLTGPPKRGKSTLVWALVNAVRRGADRFLGREITGGHVVYVSEEGRDSLAEKVNPGPGLAILDRAGSFPRRPWPEIVRAAAEEARRRGAVLVVVDTLPWWAALGADAEKDAGRMQEALEPLLELASGGFAVLVIHHDRKGGGEDGEGARGSSAAVATVDAILDLQRRGPHEAPSARRTLVGLSRWAGQTPEALIFERQGDGSLVALAEGERGEVDKRALRDRVLAAVDAGEPTQDEIAEALDVTRQRVGPVLGDLVRTGEVEKIESSRRNVAAKYRRAGSVATPRRNPPCDEHHSPMSAVSSPSPIGGDDNGDVRRNDSVATPSDIDRWEALATESDGEAGS